MADIYGLASRVFGYLGPNEDIDEKSADLFFQHAQNFSSYFYGEGDRLDSLSNKHHLSEQALVEGFESFEQILGEDFGSFTQTLTKIFQRPWFERIWILQEATLPGLPLLCLLGRHMIIADTFGKLWTTYIAVGQLGTNRILESLRLTISSGPAKLLLFRSTYQGFFNRTMSTDISELDILAERLLRLILSASFGDGSKSTLEHDMIYGLLGLLHHNLPPYLVPDYRRPFSEEYHTYAKFLIGYTRDLTILCAKKSSPDAILPTWVPDFRCLKYLPKIPSTLAKASFSADDRQMILEGVVYDRCVSVNVPPLDRSNANDETLYRLFEAFDKDILQLASSIQQKHPQEVQAEWISLALNPSGTSSKMAKFNKLGRFAYECRVKRCKPSTTAISALEKANTSTELLDSLDNILATHMLTFSHAVMNDASVFIFQTSGTEILFGDILCVMRGSAYPLLLRPWGDEHEFIACATSTTARELQENFSERFFFLRVMQSFTIV